MLCLQDNGRITHHRDHWDQHAKVTSGTRGLKKIKGCKISLLCKTTENTSGRKTTQEIAVQIKILSKKKISSDIITLENWQRWDNN